MRQLVTVVIAAALLGIASSAVAQSASPSSDELLRRIAALEAQLAELRAAVQSREPEQAQAPADQAEASSVFRDMKVAVGLDTYYMFNTKRPIGRVNLLRAYDITSNNFSLNQASLIAESPVNLEAGRRFGARIDLQYGQATETLQGSLANEPRPWVYRNIFQAYGTYVAPIGSGLTVDFGKWASSLGLEGNYTKDQMNYSRSYYFNFLPFYHTGARVNYQFNDKVAVNYWITNGTQQTEAFNNFKDQFVGLVWKPTRTVTWTTQYYLGQEHPDVVQISTPGPSTLPTQPGLSTVPVDPYFTGKLHIFDTYVNWQPNDKTTVAAEADYVTSQNPAPAEDSKVSGGALWLRRQLTRNTALAARAEYLRDQGGLFTGVTQDIKETTVTYDYRVADGLLLRSEWRRDFSNTRFFLRRHVGELGRNQNTVGFGAIWWFGNKQGGW